MYVLVSSQANSATDGQEDAYERRVNFGTVPGATGGYGQDQVKVSGVHEGGLVGDCFQDSHLQKRSNRTGKEVEGKRDDLAGRAATLASVVKMGY